MSQNLKIQKSPKAGYRHIYRVAKNIVESTLHIMLLGNRHVKFIFPLALAV